MQSPPLILSLADPVADSCLSTIAHCSLSLDDKTVGHPLRVRQFPSAVALPSGDDGGGTRKSSTRNKGDELQATGDHITPSPPPFQSEGGGTEGTSVFSSASVATRLELLFASCCFEQVDVDNAATPNDVGYYASSTGSSRDSALSLVSPVSQQSSPTGRETPRFSGGCDTREGNTLALLTQHTDHVLTLFTLCDALHPSEDAAADCCFTALELLAVVTMNKASGLPLTTGPKSSGLIISACLLLAWKFTTRDADSKIMVSVWNRKLLHGSDTYITLHDLLLYERDVLRAVGYVVHLPAWWAACSEISVMFWGDGSPSSQACSRRGGGGGGGDTTLAERTNRPLPHHPPSPHPALLHPHELMAALRFRKELCAKYSLLTVTLQTFLINYGRNVYRPARDAWCGGDPAHVVQPPPSPLPSSLSSPSVLWTIIAEAAVGSGVAPASVLSSVFPKLCFVFEGG